MLYEVTVMGAYFGKSPVNRFNYVSSGTPASVLGSFGLLWAMGFLGEPGNLPFRSGTLAGQWKAGVAPAYTFTNVVAKAVYDVADFYETPFLPPEPGSYTGEAMSPTAAIGFRSNRVRTDIDRGYKRLAGAAENMFDAGGVATAGAIANWNNIASEMGEVLTYDDEGNTLTFVPCVVGKQEYTTPGGRTAYRYYATLTEQMQHVAEGIDWSPYSTMRTQRSRQY